MLHRRGVYVQTVIQRANASTGEPMGPVLQTVERGTTVIVSVLVTFPDAADNVVVTARVPGGTLSPLHTLAPA